MARKAINPILRQIVGRCHVGDSNEQVIAYVISRLRDGQATFDAMPKPDQTEMKRQCRAVHAENRKLYGVVVSGRL